MKGRNPGYQVNNHWVICDRTGFAHRVDEMRETWDGLVVHKDQWESRHPQDFVRGREDDTRPVGHHRSDVEGVEEGVNGIDKTGDPDYTVPSSTNNNGL